MTLASNSELKDKALVSLSGNWGLSAVATLIYFILSGAIGQEDILENGIVPLISLLFMIFVLIPLGWGYEMLFLGVSRGKTLEIGDLFAGFKDYLRILGTILLANVYILLWCLLLLIPGIIKCYSYAMTPYILKDEPELSGDVVIVKSMAMMDGNKGKLFLLDLSFIGWAILAILTCCIGFLWLTPYVNTAKAKFYEDLKQNQQL